MRASWSLIPLLMGVALLAVTTLIRHGEQKQALAKHRAEVARLQRGPSTGPRARRGQIKPVTLKGPSGDEVTIPGPTAMVVNVWLQACSDCMPRFNAAKDFVEAGHQWPSPTANVAYGRASEEWAKTYGVDIGLVVDSGGAIVNPLGIRTFTTLVVDTEGKVVHKDYVDRPGFLERVEAALAQARAAEGPAPDGLGSPPAPTPAPPLPVQEPVLSDKRALTGIVLIALGALGGIAQLLGAGLRSSESAGAIQPWQEDLVVGGRRCAICAGRFDEPNETTRCSSCEAPYHRSCARRERVCQTASCGKRLT